MQIRKIFLIEAMAVFVILAAIPVSQAAGKIDIREKLARHIKQNPRLKKKLVERLKSKYPEAKDWEIRGNAENWDLLKVEASGVKMRIIQVQNRIPPQKMKFISAVEVLNCYPVVVTRSIKFKKEVSTSVNVTKSASFTSGVEASVSGDVFFASTSLTASAGVSFTKTGNYSKSEKKIIADATEIQFPKEIGGFVFKLTAKTIEGKGIPYTVRFEPHDESRFGFIFNAKWMGFCITGCTKEFRLDETFRDIKELFARENREFPVSGIIDISDTDVNEKRIVNYKMDQKKVRKECELEISLAKKTERRTRNINDISLRRAISEVKTPSSCKGSWSRRCIIELHVMANDAEASRDLLKHAAVFKKVTNILKKKERRRALSEKDFDALREYLKEAPK